MTAISKQDYWTLELNHIHAAHRANEAEIQSKRWFDYRQMTGAEATYLFGEHYYRQYLDSYKQTKDIRTVATVSPFTPDDIFRSNDLTSMWLARQAADSIGCKYSFYLHHVFNVFTVRGWKNLPRPNQIYSEELVISVNTAWTARCAEILQLAENKFFFADLYVGHPYQVQYYDYLVKQINSRQHKHLAVTGLLQKAVIPYELALLAFGPDVCKKALML